MQKAFLNPQGNFDPEDSHWIEHPDFGVPLVHEKQVSLVGYQPILSRYIWKEVLCLAYEIGALKL